ncbi:hypothetical protein [Microbulbifer sp. VAAF005]|uniref:hypothetical protein n=1 Tax=Microbulbifer sp. VAAF005 TaxID=3034230 RepID=UPI0024AD7754|nr:hypothetical protein [Microbulbifer sp. VAAF005]WHI45714.1 hypothetical protein P0078_18585 [Microbulbifer sp. VAAF005]
MKILPIAVTALSLAISGLVHADDNEYILYQDGTGNTASGDQSDPTIFNNLIEQTQIGDNNSVDATQSNGNTNGVITQYQEGDSNGSIALQDGTTDTTLVITLIGDTNDVSPFNRIQAIRRRNIPLQVMTTSEDRGKYQPPMV